LVAVYLSTHIRTVQDVFGGGGGGWWGKSSGRSGFCESKNSHYTLLMQEVYGRLVQETEDANTCCQVYSDRDAGDSYIMQILPYYVGV
jgi:hypothetical protein